MIETFDNYFDGDLDDQVTISLTAILLFSWSATLDSFEWNRGPALLNQHIFKVIPRPGTHQRFLFYSLKHYAPLWAVVDAHGSTMHHIKKESLGNKVWLPNLATQKALVDFLDRETSLRLTHSLQKKNACSHCWPKSADALITQTLLHVWSKSQCPYARFRVWSGWEKFRDTGKLIVLRGKFLFHERDERDRPELPLLNVSIHTGVTLYVNFRDSHIEQVANELFHIQVAYENDIAFNKMRMWQGAVGRVPSDGFGQS